MKLRNVYRLVALTVLGAAAAPFAAGCEVVSSVDRSVVPDKPQCTQVSECPETPVLFVQVKSNRKPSRSDMDAMAALRVPLLAKKYVYIWHDRVSEPEIIEVK